MTSKDDRWNEKTLDRKSLKGNQFQSDQKQNDIKKSVRVGWMGIYIPTEQIV